MRYLRKDMSELCEKEIQSSQQSITDSLLQNLTSNQEVLAKERRAIKIYCRAENFYDELRICEAMLTERMLELRR